MFQAPFLNKPERSLKEKETVACLGFNVLGVLDLICLICLFNVTPNPILKILTLFGH